MEKLFEMLEERIDELLPEGLNESASQEMINEAFNSAPYPTTVEQKGSQVDFFFDDEDDSYRIQFFGAAGSWGRDVDTVYIGKQRGRVYADNIDKIKNPNKVIATFLSVFTKFIIDNPRGITKSGFAVNLSGKAAKRFAPVLKKVLSRTMKGKVEVVKGFQPDANREFVWVMRTGKKPEDVFNGKKITDAFDFSSVAGKSTNKPSSTGVAPAKKQVSPSSEPESKNPRGRKVTISAKKSALKDTKVNVNTSAGTNLITNMSKDYFGTDVSPFATSTGADCLYVNVKFPWLDTPTKGVAENRAEQILASEEMKAYFKWLEKSTNNGELSAEGIADLSTGTSSRRFIPSLKIKVKANPWPIEKPSDGTGAAKAKKPKVDDNPLAMYGFPTLNGEFKPPKDFYLDLDSGQSLREFKDIIKKGLGEGFGVTVMESSDRVDLAISNDNITHTSSVALERYSKQFAGAGKFRAVTDWIRSIMDGGVSVDAFPVKFGARKVETFFFRIIIVASRPKKKSVVKTEETKALKFSETVKATASSTAKAVPISSMKANDLYDWAEEYNEQAATRKSLNALDADFEFSNLGGDYYFTIEPIRRRQGSKEDAVKMANSAAVKKVVRDLTKKFGAPRNVFGTIRDIDPTRPEKGDFPYVVINYGNGQGVIQGDDPRASNPDGEEATIMRIEDDVNNSKATEYDTRKRVRVVNSVERRTGKRNGVMVGSVHQSKYSGQFFVTNGVLFENGKAFLMIDGVRQSITKPKFLKFVQALAEKYPDSIDVDTVKSKMS